MRGSSGAPVAIFPNSYENEKKAGSAFFGRRTAQLEKGPARAQPFLIPFTRPSPSTPPFFRRGPRSRRCTFLADSTASSRPSGSRNTFFWCPCPKLRSSRSPSRGALSETQMTSRDVSPPHSSASRRDLSRSNVCSLSAVRSTPASSSTPPFSGKAATWSPQLSTIEGAVPHQRCRY